MSKSNQEKNNGKKTQLPRKKQQHLFVDTSSVQKIDVPETPTLVPPIESPSTLESEITEEPVVRTFNESIPSLSSVNPSPSSDTSLANETIVARETPPISDPEIETTSPEEKGNPLSHGSSLCSPFQSTSSSSSLASKEIKLDEKTIVKQQLLNSEQCTIKSPSPSLSSNQTEIETESSSSSSLIEAPSQAPQLALQSKTNVTVPSLQLPTNHTSSSSSSSSSSTDSILPSPRNTIHHISLISTEFSTFVETFSLSATRFNMPSIGFFAKILAERNYVFLSRIYDAAPSDEIIMHLKSLIQRFIDDVLETLGNSFTSWYGDALKVATDPAHLPLSQATIQAVVGDEIGPKDKDVYLNNIQMLLGRRMPKHFVDFFLDLTKHDGQFLQSLAAEMYMGIEVAISRRSPIVARILLHVGLFFLKFAFQIFVQEKNILSKSRGEILVDQIDPRACVILHNLSRTYKTIFGCLLSPPEDFESKFCTEFSTYEQNRRKVATGNQLSRSSGTQHSEYMSEIPKKHARADAIVAQDGYSCLIQ